MNHNIGIYSRLNPKLKGLGLGLLHWANVSLTSRIEGGLVERWL